MLKELKQRWKHRFTSRDRDRRERRDENTIHLDDWWIRPLLVLHEESDGSVEEVRACMTKIALRVDRDDCDEIVWSLKSLRTEKKMRGNSDDVIWWNASSHHDWDVFKSQSKKIFCQLIGFLSYSLTLFCFCFWTQVKASVRHSHRVFSSHSHSLRFSNGNREEKFFKSLSSIAKP